MMQSARAESMHSDGLSEEPAFVELTDTISIEGDENEDDVYSFKNFSL